MSMDGNGHVRTAVILQPISTPIPLTFLGLMIASTITAGLELGWVPAADRHLVGWALLAVPAPLQLLAAWWAFPARTAGAATGSAVLAGTWFGVALVYVNAAHGGALPSLGMMFAAAAAALLVPTAAEFSSGIVPGVVLLVAAARFGISAVYELTGSGGWQTASGIGGVVVAAAALYGALALELEGSLNREVLPILRVAGGRVARHGPIEQQLADVAHEPGVRRTL